MASDKTVLMLTQEVDTHADQVINELNERGVNVFRFHTFDFPQRSSITARMGSEQWDASIEYYHRLIRLDRITSVWYRRPRAFELDPNMTVVERQFAGAEAREALGGLLRSMNCLWVNHPDRMVAADYKLLQLKIASSLGLEIPSTLITNDPDEVHRFFERCEGQVIYKPMSSGMILSEDENLTTIFTNRVLSQHLEEAYRVRYTPCLFQENVPKKLELRITIIGNHVFPAEIYSQDSERSATDWRKSYMDLHYGVHRLPEEIHDKCLALIQYFGLAFAAVDMILTPDDRYVFLEVNSNGQWSWIEQETGLPLCKAMADLLSS